MALSTILYLGEGVGKGIRLALPTLHILCIILVELYMENTERLSTLLRQQVRFHYLIGWVYVGFNYMGFATPSNNGDTFTSFTYDGISFDEESLVTE
jgi:hypothetical protein